MKLDFATVKSLVHGAMLVEQRNGNVYMSRFLDAHKPNFIGTGADEYRAESLTSVHLDMITDSRKLTVGYTNAWNTTGRPFFFFDLWIDGVLTEHVGYMADMTRPIPRYEPDDALTFTLPEGTKRVSLYFPELFHLELTEVSLDDGACVAPVKHEKTILVIGDSITEGHDVLYSGTDYADLVAQGLNAELYNFGLGGARFFRRIAEPAYLPDCDLVLVALGTNNFRENGLEEFLLEMPGMMDALQQRYPGKPVWVVSPIWREDQAPRKGMCSFAQLGEHIRVETQKHPGFQFVDGMALMPHLPAMLSDGLHPNSLGHSHYARSLLSVLRSAD